MPQLIFQNYNNQIIKNKSFQNNNLNECTFNNSQLYNNNFTNNFFYQCIFYNTIIHNSIFLNNKIVLSIIVSQITNSNFENVFFDQTFLDSTNYNNIILTKCSFQNCSLCDTQFNQCQLNNTVFINCDFTNSFWQNNTFYNVSMINCIVDNNIPDGINIQYNKDFFKNILGVLYNEIIRNQHNVSKLLGIWNKIINLNIPKNNTKNKFTILLQLLNKFIKKTPKPQNNIPIYSGPINSINTIPQYIPSYSSQISLPKEAQIVCIDGEKKLKLPNGFITNAECPILANKYEDGNIVKSHEPSNGQFKYVASKNAWDGIMRTTQKNPFTRQRVKYNELQTYKIKNTTQNQNCIIPQQNMPHNMPQNMPQNMQQQFVYDEPEVKNEPKLKNRSVTDVAYLRNTKNGKKIILPNGKCIGAECPISLNNMEHGNTITLHTKKRNNGTSSYTVAKKEPWNKWMNKQQINPKTKEPVINNELTNLSVRQKKRNISSEEQNELNNYSGNQIRNLFS